MPVDAVPHSPGQTLSGPVFEYGPHRASAGTAPTYSVTITASFDDIDSDWRAFQQKAICTPYQRFAWLRIWQETIGEASKVHPVLCRVHGADGRLVAILPFGRYQRGPLKVAGWLGDKHMNYFMGLYAPGTAFSACDCRSLLAEIGTQAGIDVFQLKNQPRTWMGMTNPFAALPGEPSPSQAYSTALEPDFDAFYASRPSGRWKRQLRNKAKKLDELGAVELRHFVDGDEAVNVLETYFRQKAVRFAEAGITNPFDAEPVQAFFRRVLAEQDPREPLFELYALQQGDDVLAVYGGSGFHDRFSTSICSITDTCRKQFSPGEQLLKDVIADRCARGDAVLDLGIGESRYKRHWCPDTDDLIDVFVPLSASGHIGALLARSRQRLKRAIKQNEKAWNMVALLRTMKGARRTDAKDD